MEIYYTSKIDGKVSSSAAWSKAAGYPVVLAAALGSNAVGIYNQEGRPLEPGKPGLVVNVRGTECQKLCWHPLLPLLAVGWRDGAISFWNFEERRLEEDSKTHRTAIVSLTWSTSGDRLITADENGKVSMWKTDRYLRPIHVVSYEEQPGSKIRAVSLGPGGGASAGNAACTVFYGVKRDDKTIIKWANDQGNQGIVQEMSEDVTSITYYQEKEQLVVVDSACSLLLLGRDEADGSWTTISKMKFATGTGESASSLQVCWAAPHTLASASERDSVVRLYNFDTEDNYVLQVEGGGEVAGAQGAAKVAFLASDPRYGLMAAGTVDGRMTVFKYTAPEPDKEPLLELSKCWEVEPTFTLGDRPQVVEWGPNPRLMFVVSQSGVHVCRKTLLKQCFRDDMVVIQTEVDKLLLESLQAEGSKPPGKLQLPLQVLGVDYSRGSLLVYDGVVAQVFKVSDKNEAVMSGSFDTSSRALAINNDSIYRATEGRLEVCNVSGTVKQTLAFDDSAGGSPCVLNCNGDFLAAVTPNHTLRVFKVAGREAKPHQGPGVMLPADLGAAGLVIDVLRVNSSGTMVAALCSSSETSRDPRLFVHCFENQTTLVHDFDAESQVPQEIAWDVVESKVLAVQTLFVGRGNEEVLGGDRVSHSVTLCFVSPDHGILLQESQRLDASGAKSFVGISAPHLILNKPTSVAVGASTFTTHAAKVLMQGFAGIQDGDAATKTALLDFSYHLATGNMDEAFRAVKAIKNQAIYENMAHTAIKNKRLDVAEYCLGFMEHTRGARAAREAKVIEELDARVAMVAIHLGMVEDAKKLFIASERFDLLNKLYQACGQWDKAIELAEKSDRINLNSTHYAYAQHLERSSDLSGAQAHFEKSGCAIIEVTRMLHQAGRYDDLEKYIESKDENKQLTQWWARFCESRGEVKRALSCYEKAADVLSIVRIHCATQNYALAEDQVLKASDPAGAFHLARQYEAMGRISEAIRYYTMAHRYSHGVRLAKGHGLDSELVNLALKSTPNVMIDAADYLNEKGEHERAALLYMKGGKLSKAVEMCFAAQLFEVLQHIADDLSTTGADPALYSRCAEFFMQHGHFDKAVKMLIAASQYGTALELCLEHDVQITEDMAEAMTPGKDALPADERNLVLMRIAKLAKRQGAWQLAAKKFTQAGDKVKAMKALLRSCDTEKIVFFAGVSRQKEIYMMAANYLQTLDWHADPEVMKNIISFYTKAQAVDSLASFYEACAQVEVDEYRDYEKALQATREAVKYLSKSRSDDRDIRMSQVQHRIAMTEKFVEARSVIGHQPQQALSLCGELLMVLSPDAADLESGVRLGDVYALMVDYWYQAGNALEAYKLIEQMRSRGIMITPYVEQRVVDDVCRTLGVIAPPTQTVAKAGIHGGQYSANNGYVDDEDIVEEEQMDF